MLYSNAWGAAHRQDAGGVWVVDPPRRRCIHLNAALHAVRLPVAVSRPVEVGEEPSGDSSVQVTLQLAAAGLAGARPSRVSGWGVGCVGGARSSACPAQRAGATPSVHALHADLTLFLTFSRTSNAPNPLLLHRPGSSMGRGMPAIAPQLCCRCSLTVGRPGQWTCGRRLH